MRPVPPPLAAHLADECTTLCRCWRIARRDGIVLGFTDHDRDIAFDGTLFAARSGLDGAEATAESGFAIGGGEVAGALTDAGLAEADIAAGRFDDATVECWLVNWADPAVRMRRDRFSVGEIRCEDGAFVAELRSAAHRLDEERGRLFRPTCSADLGDDRCRVDLDGGSWRADGTVVASDGGTTLDAAGLGSHAAGWFAGGILAWTGGPNAGGTAEIAAHRAGPDGSASLDLWSRTAAPIGPGDAFRVTAGCDKLFATCRGKFGNGLNFRGFPHMPGNDFVLRVASPGAGAFDGGSLSR